MLASALLVLERLDSALLVLVSALLMIVNALLVLVSSCEITPIGKVCFPIDMRDHFQSSQQQLEWNACPQFINGVPIHQQIPASLLKNTYQDHPTK